MSECVCVCVCVCVWGVSTIPVLGVVCLVTLYTAAVADCLRESRQG